MPETRGINAGGGIKNIGSDSAKNQSYEYFRTPQKQKVFKLHVGELVQATVMSNPIEGEATVRLPIGTMNAELQGQLKKGDTLFFRVESIEPTLVLKIYSVPAVISGKKTTLEEILRILDLPYNILYLDVVEYLIATKNIIVRNECLFLFSNLNQLGESILKIHPKSALLKTLNLFNQVKLHFNFNLFMKFLPVFLGAMHFEKTLRKLEKQIRFLPSEIQNNFIGYYSNLISSDIETNIYKFVNLTESETLGEQTFYQFLNKIKKQIESIYPNEFNNFIAIIKEIINTLEGQFLYNVIAERTNESSYLYIPIFNKNQIKLVQLMWKKIKEEDFKESDKTNFTFVMDIETSGKVTAKGIATQTDLIFDMIIQNKELSEKVSAGIDKLKMKLASDSFITKSLRVIDIEEEDLKTIQEESKNRGSSFSVVI